MEVRIPFAGFYESDYSEAIDAAVEREADRFKEEHSDISVEELLELINRHCDFNSVFRKVAEDYVNEFEKYLTSDAVGVSIMLKFNDLVSPREYNFQTDALYASVSIEDVRAVRKYVGEKALAKQAKKMFTSRSGFVSFYSPNVKEWGDIEKWDHNQLYCLFLSCVDQEDMDITILESMMDSGMIDKAVSEAIDWHAIKCAVEEMEEKGISLEEYDKTKDARKFPKSPNMNVVDYVREYEKLNNLVP
jgi:hypothetical protein